MSTVPNFSQQFKPYTPRPTVIAQRRDWRGTAIFAAVGLALGLLAVLTLWPKPEMGDTARSIVLSGPIIGFQQSQDEVRVRVAATDKMDVRRQLVVRPAGPDTQATILPVSRGDSWIAVKLTGALADATSLEVGVEQNAFHSGQVASN